MSSRALPLLAGVLLLLCCGPTSVKAPAPNPLLARVKPSPALLHLDEAKAHFVLGQASLSVATPAVTFGGVHLRSTAAPFDFGPGTQSQDTIVYRAEAASLVLTPGLDGVKEDLIIHAPIADSLRLEWSLTLDSGLSARLEADGSVAISSGAKRLFELPAPTLRDATGFETGRGLRFELDGTTLRLIAEGLGAYRYPLDLDPTIVTTSADFALGGNFETDVTNTNTQLTRAVPTTGPGNWATTTALPTGRSRHTSVVANGFVYVLGGLTSGGSITEVRYAAINPGGLGAWGTTTPFATARSRHASVAYNGFIYVSGGLGGTLLADVQYAKLNADGTVGTWATTTALPSARSGHAMVAANGFLYVLGGLGASGALADVWVATILADGSLSSFASLNVYANPRTQHAAAANNGFLYISGGTNGAGDLADVQFAQMLADGTLSAWANTSTMPTPLAGHSMTASSGSLIITGGTNAGTANARTLLGPVSANGPIPSWVITPSTFTTARSGHTSVVANGVLYVIAGVDAVLPFADVQYATLNTFGSLGGTVGAWSMGTAFPTPRFGHQTVTVNGFIYVMAGVNATSMYVYDTQFTKPNPDGTITSWTTTLPPPGSRQLYGAAAYNGYVYITGGGVGTYNDVWYSKVNTDGTLGTWAFGGNFTGPRYGHGTVAYNGYLYVWAGATNSLTMLGDVQVAPINANGSIGAFVTTTPMPTPRYNFGGVAYNGYLYALGGATGMYGPWVSSVDYAPINADGTLGAWSTTSTFTTPRGYFAAIAHNGSMVIAGGYSAIGFLADSQSAPINGDGTLGPWATTATMVGGRAYQTPAAINGTLYLFGGSTGGGYYNEAMQGPLQGPVALATYSKLFDFGSNVNIDTVTLGGKGSSTLGTVRVAYRTSSTTTLGALVDKGSVAIGTSVPISTTARYLWLRTTLDDTQNATAVSSGHERDVSDITITFLLDNGTACTVDAECLSAACIDTVCCNTRCTGACDACNLAGTVGTCTNQSAGFAGAPSCTPYVCGGAATCPTTCTADVQCIATSYCATNTCVPKLTNGTLCTAANQCASNQCVDGVCCNSACTGSCNQCNLGGSSGTCTNLAAGAPGSPVCAPYLCGGAATCPAACTVDSQCVATAYCDGTACVTKQANGASCTGANQCANGQCVDGVCCNSACGGACDVCNGAGALGVCKRVAAGVAGAPSCSPYVCSGASSNCPTTCTLDSQCATDAYCTGGACTPKHVNGTPCTATNECASGSCVDGVCCNTACGGACDACDVTGSLGTCTFSPKGSPGTPSCAPLLCTGNLAGCPTSCTDDTSCLAGQYCQNSVCQGRLDPGFACMVGNECVSGHCVDGVCCNSDCVGACDACNLTGSMGACTPVAVGASGSPSCAPFVCYGAADCPTNCTTDVQCSVTTYCSAGACVPRQAAGATCSTANQCASGFCADGTCCNALCDGACDACNLSGSVGQCTTLAAGAPGAPSCTPYVCGGGASCPSTCADSSSCVEGYACSNGVCAVTVDAGVPFKHTYGVGCGCDASGDGGVMLWCLLGLLWLASKPPRSGRVA